MPLHQHYTKLGPQPDYDSLEGPESCKIVWIETVFHSAESVSNKHK